MSIATIKYETTRTHPTLDGSVQFVASVRASVGGFRCVSQAIEERAQSGFDVYGGYLTTNNGHNPKVDAFQELIDAVVYLEQALREESNHERMAMLFDMQYDLANIAERLRGWIDAD